MVEERKETRELLGSGKVEHELDATTWSHDEVAGS